MPQAKGSKGAARRRRGISPHARAAWRATYEKTPYDRLPWFDPDPSPCLTLAVAERFFRPRGAVLDVGCGAGSNVIYLAQKGYRAHGVDLSPGAVAAARSRGAKEHVAIDVQEGDALLLPFRDGALDGVLDHGCFHTLPFSRRREYAEEIRRVLRPDGSFLLAWVAREHTGPMGPTHRPSLQEVAAVFESRFQFLRTGIEEGGLPSYFAFLRRRSKPQPPRM